MVYLQSRTIVRVIKEHGVLLPKMLELNPVGNEATETESASLTTLTKA